MDQDQATGGIPAAGDIIADRYEVEDILGSGGMGVVVAARHVGLGQRVAIKFLVPEMASRPDVVARFMREARAGASIRSDHVARIYDVAKLPNGAPYLVMERLAGHDLEKEVRERGALPISQAVDYVLQACEAIAEAHAQGIVHRDLKTANLFLAQRADGSVTVKILDFGISKMVDAAVGLTADSTTLGSPGFISPEQLRSTKTADHRTDIWALGVVLHRLLTASMPFDGARIPDCLAKILHDPPPPIRSLRPEAPAELEAVILRCLEKPLERRVQDAAELALLLAPFAKPTSQASIERIVRSLRGANAVVPVLVPSAEPPAPEPAPSAPAPAPSAPEPPAPPRPEDATRTLAVQVATAPTAALAPDPRAVRMTIPLQQQRAAPLPPTPTLPMPIAPPPEAEAASPAPAATRGKKVLPAVAIGVVAAIAVAGWAATRTTQPEGGAGRMAQAPTAAATAPPEPPRPAPRATTAPAETAAPRETAAPVETSEPAPVASSTPVDAPASTSKAAPGKPGPRGPGKRRNGSYLDRW